MVDKSTILQIFGSLMRHPQFLSETDKYNLTPTDFPTLFEKYIFGSIENLYFNGAARINPIDIENYLESNESAKKIFKEKNGIEYLQDAEQLSDESNFQYYYTRLKKINLLNSLCRQGIDISDFYREDISEESFEINKHFEELSIEDIITKVKTKILKTEREFIQNDTTEVVNIADGIEELLEEAENHSGIGIPVQGIIFNEVIAGARRGAFVLRSAGSGVGKSRQAVGDACYLAFPIRYDDKTCKWIQKGNNEKVLFITTEQTGKEIQRMVLAYLTGFNESKFRYGNFTEDEKLILKQTLWVLKTYEDNFRIIKMPNPTIELVKTIVRENVTLYDIGYVFYDYIHISPSLINEFKGVSLRNDELLLMFSTALKDLAVELDVFVMSSTQLNAKGDDNTNIRNESALAGSRAVINKADVGVIIARPTQIELQAFQGMAEAKENFIMPNIVTDVYKVRSGQWNQLRIWSYVDLGNLRKIDLFTTNAALQVVEVEIESNYIDDWENSFKEEVRNNLDYVNGIKLND